MSVWFKSSLNPWYIWIISNPNLYSTKIMKMRWQPIASNFSIRTISPTATPLPKAYDCVAVYIAGRRTSLAVYGWWPQPPTNNKIIKIRVRYQLNRLQLISIQSAYQIQLRICHIWCDIAKIVSDIKYQYSITFQMFLQMRNNWFPNTMGPFY